VTLLREKPPKLRRITHPRPKSNRTRPIWTTRPGRVRLTMSHLQSPEMVGYWCVSMCRSWMFTSVCSFHRSVWSGMSNSRCSPRCQRWVQLSLFPLPCSD